MEKKNYYVKPSLEEVQLDETILLQQTSGSGGGSGKPGKPSKSTSAPEEAASEAYTNPFE